MRILVGLVLALALWGIAGVFSVNGHQWAWWTWVSVACAVIVLTVCILRRAIVAVLQPERHRVVIAVGGTAGGAVVVLSLVIMARRYSDPYAGPLFWPHMLAFFALGGFALLAICVAALAGPAERRSATPTRTPR